MCGATITVQGETYACEMSGHTKPDALGPTHFARTRAESGQIVVIRWATKR